MHTRLLLSFAAVAIAATALAGCASTTSATPSAPVAKTGGTATPVAVTDTLAAASTTLGTIVVNSSGNTVYVFDDDKANSGTSACYGGCASAWPAVTTTSAAPTMSGVTGTIGTITRTDGTRQVTLDGMPLYTFASDAKAGDVSGEGVEKAWFVVSPAGKQITAAPGSATKGSSGGSGSSSSGDGW